MNWLQGLVKDYWPHMTGGTIATVLAVVFKDTLNDIWIGFKNYLGAKWAERFSDVRRKSNKRQADVTIGALTQQVKDQGRTITGLVRRVGKAEKRLESCQAERTECRSDLRNLVLRVSALERK